MVGQLSADTALTKPLRWRSSWPGSGAARARPAADAPIYRFGTWGHFRRAAEIRRDGPVGTLGGSPAAPLLRRPPGATLSRNELLDEVWGYDAMPTTRTVDVHVAWLRRKLEPNPRHPQFILTLHGLGYKFVG